MLVPFSCSFFMHDPHLGLNNNVIFDLRRELSHMMERCGFGDVISLEEERFANVEIAPVEDAYYDDTQELVICYRWSASHPGAPHFDQWLVNIASDTNGVPSLRRYLDNNYPYIDFISKIIWA